MNNHTLTFTHTITNSGTFNVINNGTIYNNLNYPITNKGTLNIGTSTLKSKDWSCIYGNEGTGTITIDGATLDTNQRGIRLGSGQKVIINSGLILGLVISVG
jgi:hypothetical protein